MHYDVTVAIQTWPRYPERLQYLERIVRAGKKQLRFPTPARWIAIAESYSPQDLSELLTGYCEREGIELFWKESQPDIGSAQNLLYSKVESPYVLYLQDDYLYHKPVRIATDIEVLKSGYDIVQHAWSWDPWWANSNWCWNVEDAKYHHIGFLQKWYYRDNPFIAKTDSIRKVGPFAERQGTNGGFAEHDFSRRARDHLTIAGRGEATFDYLLRHIGCQTSMTEKWVDIGPMPTWSAWSPKPGNEEE